MLHVAFIQTVILEISVKHRIMRKSKIICQIVHDDTKPPPHHTFFSLTCLDIGNETADFFLQFAINKTPFCAGPAVLIPTPRSGSLQVIYVIFYAFRFPPFSVADTESRQIFKIPPGFARTHVRADSQDPLSLLLRSTAQCTSLFSFFQVRVCKFSAKCP